MFAFSLSKLVVLVGVVVAVIYGSRLLTRLQALREAEVERRRAAARGSTGARAIEDTEKCRVCAAYVPARGATDCGQPGCPYGV